MSTITMQELELETAELLPPRETLWVASGSHQSNYSANGNGNQDTSGGGGFLSPTVAVNFLNFDGNGNNTYQSNSN
jgi:hypothetical protein